MEDKTYSYYDTSAFEEMHRAVELSKKDAILADIVADMAQDILMHGSITF